MSNLTPEQRAEAVYRKTANHYGEDLSRYGQRMIAEFAAALRQATAQEREECAALCERSAFSDEQTKLPVYYVQNNMANGLARMIRNRGASTTTTGASPCAIITLDSDGGE